MKVAVTAVEPHLNAQVDPRFGRCQYFLVVETDDLSFELIENANQNLAQGAGIQSALLLAERGVRYVLTGNCGPNAHQSLSAAAIRVIVGCAGTVRQVIEQFTAGLLEPTESANVPGHSGLPASDARQPLSEQMPDPPFNPGTAPLPRPPGGAGMGQNRGLGRGMGRGLGPGRGRGMGGRGMGRGMGRGGGRGRGGA